MKPGIGQKGSNGQIWRPRVRGAKQHICIVFSQNLWGGGHRECGLPDRSSPNFGRNLKIFASGAVTTAPSHRIVSGPNKNCTMTCTQPIPTTDKPRTNLVRAYVELMHCTSFSSGMVRGRVPRTLMHHFGHGQLRPTSVSHSHFVFASPHDLP